MDYTKYLNGITEAQANEMLKKDVAIAEAAVNKLVKVALSQNRFDVLVCFTYNFNETKLASSGVLRAVNRGDFAAVPGELAKWNKSGSPPKVMTGLVTRRRREGELFSK